MHKGIYLDVQVALDRPVAAPGSPVMRGGVVTPEHAAAEVKQTVQEAMKNGTSTAGLTGDIKHIRPGKHPNHVEVLLYMEGEQEAPENFMALATSEVQKTLE